jgi:hypothetical protein
MNLKYALRSEDTEQIAVINWAQWNMQRYPELELLHHVPNGGSRNKKRGLMPPMDPDMTPMYSFSDLQMRLYYDIFAG